MKKKLFNLLLISAVMFIAGCEDTIYNVYNDFTGPVESVSLPLTMSVVIHTTEQLKASVYPSMTENKAVTWEIVSQSDVSGNSATGIATIDSSGRFTGNVLGSAIVRVTTVEGGFTAESVVSVVSAPIAITAVTLDKTSVTIGSGQSANIIASFTPSDATSTELTWTSSNSAVANVSGTGTTGTVTGGNLGTATITVASVHWNKSATCTVTVGEATFSVTYNANLPSGVTSTGVVPVDDNVYKNGDSATIKYNTGTTGSNGIVCTGYTFNRWSTTPEGTAGTLYDPGNLYPVTKNLIFYAQWTMTTYTVTYSCSDNTRGTVPAVQSFHYGDTVTIQSFSDSTGGLMKTDGTAAYYSSWMYGSTEMAEGSTFSMPANNVTLIVKWNPYTATYNAVPLKGPSGGYVVYDSGSYGTKGWRYLELAPASTETTTAWGDSGSTFANNTTTLTGMGDGAANTIYLAGKLSPAAVYCSDLSIAGYSDWFLPSIDELTAMLITNYTFNKAVIAMDQDGRYWSSSSDADDFEHAQDYIFMGSGSSFMPYKAQDVRSFNFKVRAARRF